MQFRLLTQSTLLALVLFCWPTAVPASPGEEQTRERPPTSPDSVVIPAVRNGDAYDRTTEIPEPAQALVPPTAWGAEARTYDGFGNNVANPLWGSAGVQFLRTVPAQYADGVSTPGGVGRPNPRTISNAIVAQSSLFENTGLRSDFIWMWGQLLDHDLDLAGTAAPAEPFDVQIPMGDAQFDPFLTGTQIIPLDRSAYDPTTGTGPGNPRQQVNVLVAYVDASNVYGSGVSRANALRTMDGTGRMKVSAGNMLPFNLDGLPNGGGTGANLFVAGDVRSNEQVALTALHTLFVREHNRLANQIHAAEPALDDEEIYQRARAIVGAQMQVITYKEWLPALIGGTALPPYTGYDPSVNAGVTNEFATAAFRVGHTMLSPTLKRLNSGNQPIPQGNLALRDAFFAPQRLTGEGGIDPLLRGGAFNPMQQIDAMIVDDVRNFLFGPPGAGGFDLACLNVQRGREHGLPSYNAMCAAMGVPTAVTSADITSDPQIQAGFDSAYGSMNDVDLWVGAVAEDHYPGAQVGPLIRSILIDQFGRVRDGDRFWYQEYFTGPLLAELENTRLSDIIRRNTNIGDEIQENVFHATSPNVPTVSQWGLVVLLLVGLTLATVLFGRRTASDMG
ncbi:MAG: hypothetical protein HOP29_07765 [Phycisphaerales bacterium]|nr:hypothetical protein [Phycisphaerales bacterium]